MKSSQIIYPLIFILAIYFIYSNLKNSLKYKKENMKPLLYLNNDDKTRRKLSTIVIMFVLVLTVFLVAGTISTGSFTAETAFTILVLPVLMAVLYIPLTKRTMVSTLGIHKRGGLIRWEEIKGINYMKPDEKNIVAAKVLYSLMGKDITTELKFHKDDESLAIFKETVKEYRNSKKKEKKSGK
ncbi:MAG TPA: hypothetical protein DEF04_08515 [Clostridiales bacterium]|nr:hypothetical protein [Clostridiales bacterium]